MKGCSGEAGRGGDRWSGLGSGTVELLDLAQSFRISTPPETRSSRLSRQAVGRRSNPPGRTFRIKAQLKRWPSPSAAAFIPKGSALTSGPVPSASLTTRAAPLVEAQFCSQEVRQRRAWTETCVDRLAFELPRRSAVALPPLLLLSWRAGGG